MEIEDKRDNKKDFVIRGMLCILDLAFPNETLTDKARNIKSMLRKRIMDAIHQIEYENSKIVNSQDIKNYQIKEV